MPRVHGATAAAATAEAEGRVWGHNVKVAQRLFRCPDYLRENEQTTNLDKTRRKRAQTAAAVLLGKLRLSHIKPKK